MKYIQPYGVADPDASFVNGNPATGTPGSIPPAAAMEHPQREILAVITGAGLVPNAGNLHQLKDAILALIAGQTTSTPDYALLHYGVAGGLINALTLTTVPPLVAYAAGATVIFLPAGDNTAAATLNVNTLGIKELRRADGITNLAAGDLRAGRLAVATYDGAVFRLHGSGTGLPTIVVSDAGTADALSGPGFPSMSAWTAGQLFLITKAGAANTIAAPTLNVDGKGAKTIVKRDGSALAPADLIAAAAFLAAYDGTNVRLLHSVASDVVNSVATAKAPFNMQRFVNTTRVSATGTPGTPTSVWSGISFTKKSATSALVAWVSFQTQYVASAPATYVRLTCGASYAEAVLNAPGAAYTIGQSGILVLPGLSAGVKTLDLGLLNPGFNWATIFNPVSSDYAGYAGTTTAVLVIAEVEL